MLTQALTIREFKGMDNRSREEAIPDGWLRNAVNVSFDLQNKCRLSPGVQRVYTGTNVHSYWDGYFVDNGVLKHIDAQNTVVTLRTGIGDTPMVYTRVGSRVFCSNGKVSLILTGAVAQTWGLSWPGTLLCFPTGIGGLFAGDYLVSITWMRGDEESGCGPSARVAVQNGGGIYYRVPGAPSDVDAFALYVSNCNSAELYLFDEYPIDKLDGVIGIHDGSITLETQNLYAPPPCTVLQEHFGRIYFASDNVLRFTEPMQYSFTKAFNNWVFPSPIRGLVSLPQVLYVIDDATWRVDNIDVEGGPTLTKVLDYGCVPGSVVYDPMNPIAYWQSDRGVVRASTDGAEEMLLDHVAMPSYAKGAATILEQFGLRQWIGVSRGGNVSGLISPDYAADEIARTGSAF